MDMSRGVWRDFPMAIFHKARIEKVRPQETKKAAAEATA